MRVAYLSLQAVEEGQDSWAAVNEISDGWRDDGWTVDLWAVRYKKRVPSWAARLRAMIIIQNKLRKCLTQYDLVYIRSHTMAYFLARNAWSQGIPVVQECNGTYEDLFIAWPITRILRPLFTSMQRWQYKHALLTITVTAQLKRWVEHEAPGQSVFISPNGASTDVFTPEAPKRDGLPEKYIVFFGQFAPWQGIGPLLEAKADPAWPDDVSLVFVGDGVMKKSVEEAVSRDSQVSYLGRLPYRELAGVVAHSLAAVSFQDDDIRGADGLSPLKLYESMACGVPILGADYPGLGNVLEDTCSGIAVAPRDTHGFAVAVRWLSENPSEARKMGKNGRLMAVNEYSWKCRSEQRRQAIEEALGMNKKPL